MSDNADPLHPKMSKKTPPRARPGSDSCRLYRQMVLIRRFEQTTQIMLRNRELPGFVHLYIGQEATAVGVMAHLRPDDWITSTHRGHGHAWPRASPQAPVGRVGRQGHRLLRRTRRDHARVHALGGAVWDQRARGRRDSRRPSDWPSAPRSAAPTRWPWPSSATGRATTARFHEALNFAGIQNAPVVFVCENNLYATATPLSMATRNTNIASKAAAYGFPGVQVDGNDVLAVWQAAGEAVRRARAGEGPTLIESLTYRQVGHQEGDPVIGWCRTQEEWDAWIKRCPIAELPPLPAGIGACRGGRLEGDRSRSGRRDSGGGRFRPPVAVSPIRPRPLRTSGPSRSIRRCRTMPTPTRSRPKRWCRVGWTPSATALPRKCDAIRTSSISAKAPAIAAAASGIPRTCSRSSAARRMIDTPICELGFTGASIGASATGCRAVADLMMADFLWEAGGQIVLQASKLRYMSNGQVSVPMVVRARRGRDQKRRPAPQRHRTIPSGPIARG